MNNFKSIIQSHNNFIFSKYNEMTTQINKNNNKHYTINGNKIYSNNTYVINISQDRINNRVNINNVDNINNRPITKNISKNLTRNTNSIVPNDSCSNSNNNNSGNKGNSSDPIDNNDNSINNNSITINSNNNNCSNQNNINFSNINNNEVIKPGFKLKNNVSKSFNCRKSNKLNCLLHGYCLIKNVVYKVRVKCNLSGDNNKNNSNDNIIFIRINCVLVRQGVGTEQFPNHYTS